MTRHVPTRRAAAALLSAVLGLGVLSACGQENDKDPEDSSSASEESSESEDSSGESDPAATEDPAILDSVTIEGDFGTEPTVEFEALDPQALVSKDVLVGKDEPVEAGDQVYIHLWIANAKTTKVGMSSYETGPEPVTVDPAQLPPFILKAIEGKTVGSRTVVAAPAADAYGDQGNEQLGIGPDEPVLTVVDVVRKALTEPSGTEQTPADWAPKVVETDGVPSSFDFAGTTPSKDLQVTTLIEGDGPEVEKGQFIIVNYLGQVPGSKEPFDASYGRGAFQFRIGEGQVVKGWDQGLVGVPVGSRVILSIPPALGYGKKGQDPIKGTDTMYFVIDVLGAG